MPLNRDDDRQLRDQPRNRGGDGGFHSRPAPRQGQGPGAARQEQRREQQANRPGLVQRPTRPARPADRPPMTLPGEYDPGQPVAVLPDADSDSTAPQTGYMYEYSGGYDYNYDFDNPTPAPVPYTAPQGPEVAAPVPMPVYTDPGALQPAPSLESQLADLGFAFLLGSDGLYYLKDTRSGQIYPLQPASPPQMAYAPDGDFVVSGDSYSYNYEYTGTGGYGMNAAPEMPRDVYGNPIMYDDGTRGPRYMPYGAGALLGGNPQFDVETGDVVPPDFFPTDPGSVGNVDEQWYQDRERGQPSQPEPSDEGVSRIYSLETFASMLSPQAAAAWALYKLALAEYWAATPIGAVPMGSTDLLLSNITAFANQSVVFFASAASRGLAPITAGEYAARLQRLQEHATALFSTAITEAYRQGLLDGMRFNQAARNVSVLQALSASVIEAIKSVPEAAKRFAEGAGSTAGGVGVLLLAAAAVFALSKKR